MFDKTKATEALATRWYAALDTHEPTQTLVDMLDPSDLKMVFPEATLSGVEGFVGWYEGVIRIFFDEVHKVESVTLGAEANGRTEAKVAVHWEASRWNAQAAKSDRILLTAYQNWDVTFTDSGDAKVAKYTVDRLEYLPGSAQL
jgi:hypothetical protein